MNQTNTKVSVRATVGSKELTLSTGQLAKQAGGAVVARLGDTVVLATATIGRPFSPDADYMPLLVDYEEKFYAAGKIKGSRFIKREGRPTDDAILNARLIDRAIRPLFPDNMINDIQIVLTILSYDGENDPDVVSLTAACAAISISDIPWNGPLAGVRVGQVDGQFIINPTVVEREKSTIDLIVAGTGDRITMIEAGAQEVPEDVLLDALEEAQRGLGMITPLIDNLVAKVGKAKQEPTLFARDEEAYKKIKELALPLLKEKLANVSTKDEIGTAERSTQETVAEQLSSSASPPESKTIREAIHELHGEYQRERILKDDWRADGLAA